MSDIDTNASNEGGCLINKANSVKLDAKEVQRLKDKYENPSIVYQQIDLNSLKEPKVQKPEEALKLQEKYKVLASSVANGAAEKENKKKRKHKATGRLKKSRRSDPVITDISDMMSNSLKIISPEKACHNIPPEDSQLQDDSQADTINGTHAHLALIAKTSENDAEHAVDVVKKKKSRLSLNPSPKAPKSKFKECSQQSKLNGFIQIKSPEKGSDAQVGAEKPEEKWVSDNPEGVANLKVSTNLFKSPRSKNRNIRRVTTHEILNNTQQSETEMIENEQEEQTNINSDTSKTKKVHFSKKVCHDSPESIDKNILDLKDDIDLNCEYAEENVDLETTVKTNNSSVKDIKSKINANKNIQETNAGIHSISEYLKEKFVLETTSNALLVANNSYVRDVDPKVNASKNEQQTNNKINSKSEYLKEKFVLETTSNASLEIINSNVAMDHNELQTNDSNYPEKSDGASSYMQINAFQFMMNRRHKVIGSNSPGKEAQEPFNEEIASVQERKDKLASRREKLKEWNDRKGGVKRKIMEEEEREEFVDQALTKRAKRLKKLLHIDAPEQNTRREEKKGGKRKSLLRMKHLSESSEKSVTDNASINKKVKKTKIVTETNLCSNNDKTTPDEIIPLDASDNLLKNENVVVLDESVDEHLFKQRNLTDSPKVQAGLLNFFDVLKKTSADKNTEVNCSDDEADQQDKIKIKMFTPKSRRKLSTKDNDDVVKKSKKKKTTNEILSQVIVNGEIQSISKKKNTTKIMAASDICGNNNKAAPDEITPLDARNSLHKDDLLNIIKNKLKTKLVTNHQLKAASESEDSADELIECFSGDHSDGSTEKIVPEPRRSLRVRACHSYTEEEVSQHKLKNNDKKTASKEKKVAPIFLKMLPKPKLDPAVVQARFEFLHSGVPDSLKIIMEKQEGIEDIDYAVFPSIAHVQQKPSHPSEFWNLPRVRLNLTEPKQHEFTFDPSSLSGVLNCDVDLPQQINLRPPTKRLLFKAVLQEIKMEDPEFPVYKTFKMMREQNGLGESAAVKQQSPVKKKRGRPRKKTSPDELVITEIAEATEINTTEYAMWTDKYRPKSSDDIIGNQKSLIKLKRWLQKWIDFSQEVKVTRKRRRDSSDFESETDSEGRSGVPLKTMILRGPLGSGKSTAVYAVCQELNINVLELNASSKRTGKKLLQDLQEATQSHQVNKNELNGLASFLQKKKTTTDLQDLDNGDKKMCLLLIEDVDIVFEQDDGFISALSQLLLSSKRPLAMTTSNVECTHIQKLMSQYPVLTFTALSAKTLGTWLQILCLLEGLKVDKCSIGELLEWNKGDVRRTLLQLQFWVQTGGVPRETVSFSSLYRSQNVDHTFDDVCEDDLSNCSFLDNEDATNSSEPEVHDDCVNPFLICSRYKLYLPYPLNLGVVWWNLPDILHFNHMSHKPKIKSSIRRKTNSATKNSYCDLQNIFHVMDVLSLSDTLNKTEGVDLDVEPCCRSWEDNLKEGLSLTDNFSDYKSDRSLLNDLMHTLVESYCKICNTDFRTCVNMAVPVPAERRWRNKRHECESQFFEAVPWSSSVHRSAFAVDYFPTLRCMSRAETVRSSNNRKRGNRFHNYLRNLNICPSNSAIKTACNMFVSQKSAP